MAKAALTGDEQLKPKRKPRVRRKIVTAPEPVVESAPAAAAARFVEVTKIVPARSKSWGLILVQLVFASALVVAAYIGYHELMRVRQEAAQREAALRQQLGEQVDSVQQRFDSLLALLDKQKEEKPAPAKRLEDTLPLSSVVISYPASLAGMATKAGTSTFAANPDIWIQESTEFTKEALVCAKPLQISAEGYCDNVKVSGINAVDEVYVEREAGSITRIVRSLSFSSGKDGKVMVQIRVDLGTPTVNGRDVFEPTNAKDQEAAVESFLRSLLKKELLPVVLAENVALFEDIVAHLRLP